MRKYVFNTVLVVLALGLVGLVSSVFTEQAEADMVPLMEDSAALGRVKTILRVWQTNAVAETEMGDGSLSPSFAAVTVSGAITANGNIVGDGSTIMTNLGQLVVGSTRWDDGSDGLDGEVIANDTIDDDAIDFADVTGADLTLTDAAAVTASGAITANGGIVNATVANITPLTFTTTNTHAILSSRSVQLLTVSGVVITNTLANPAAVGDYLEVWNVSAVDLIINDAANIEGAGAITLSQFDGVAYRAQTTGVWLEMWRANN